MRRKLSAAMVVAAGLIATPPAHAAIPQVFTKTATPLNCTVQANGQRFCSGQILSPGTGSRSTSTSASRPRSTPDASYPVIGIYHGWGGTKLALDERRRPARAHPRLRLLHA